MTTKPASPPTTTPTTRPTTPSPPGSSKSRTDASRAFDRLLPQDIDAERAVLGSMLHGHEAIAEVIAALGDVAREVFARERHQQLYDVFVQLHIEDQPIDGKLIEQELTRRGLWEKLGKYDFLAGLLGAVPSALRARHYAEIIRDKYLLRRLIGATHQVMEGAFEDDRPAREILDNAEKVIFEVTERRVTGEALALPELIQEAFETIERRGENALTGLETGFADLDELTCGWQRGELIIIAARPSVGKTALGLNMAEHLAVVNRRPSVFFSLEMSRQQIAQRLLCSRARVDSHKLRRGRHSAQDMEDLQRAAQDLSQATLLVDDSADLTVLELRARSRMAHRRFGIEAIFVDYLQLMRVPRSESRQVEVAAVSRGLKALAKDLNVPVIAMAQLNRNPEDKGRQGNRPRMSDLRESGAIEQDADVIALLHREAYRKDPPTAGQDTEGAPVPADPNENLAELIIAKQRNGPVGTVKLNFVRQSTRFENHMPDSGPF